MSGRRSLLRWGTGAVLSGLALLLGGCGGTPPVSKNVRVELHLTINGEARTWSTVQNVSIKKLGGDGAGVLRKYDIDVSGGALIAQPVANLPALVMLMDVGGGEVPYDDLLVACMVGVGGGDLMSAVDKFSGTCRIPRDVSPTVIAMADAGNPSAILAFHLSNLSGWFGVPVEFGGITLASTAEPVDRGVLTALPWTRRGQRPEGTIYAPFADGDTNGITLNYRAFVRGID